MHLLLITGFLGSGKTILVIHPRHQRRCLAGRLAGHRHPDDVYNYVRDQVELFEGKELLLCPGCDAPINARPENMEAFVAAAHEYGKVAV